jgi:hypothetical protein
LPLENKHYELKGFSISEFFHPPDDGYVNAFGVSLNQLAPELPTRVIGQSLSILSFS